MAFTVSAPFEVSIRRELALWDGLCCHYDHDRLARMGVHRFGRRNGWQFAGVHRSSQLAIFGNSERAVRDVDGGRKVSVTRRERTLRFGGRRSRALPTAIDAPAQSPPRPPRSRCPVHLRRCVDRHSDGASAEAFLDTSSTRVTRRRTPHTSSQ